MQNTRVLPPPPQNREKTQRLSAFNMLTAVLHILKTLHWHKSEYKFKNTLDCVYLVRTKTITFTSDPKIFLDQIPLISPAGIQRGRFYYYYQFPTRANKHACRLGAWVTRNSVGK